MYAEKEVFVYFDNAQFQSFFFQVTPCQETSKVNG